MLAQWDCQAHNVFSVGLQQVGGLGVMEYLLLHVVPLLAQWGYSDLHQLFLLAQNSWQAQGRG